MVVSADDERAPYVQVADTLRHEIRSGQLKPGQKLPSTRQLAEKFGVASMTAANGVRVLREEGLVTATQGRGTFVCQNEQPTQTPETGGADPDVRLAALEQQVKVLAERLASVEASLADR